LRKRKYVRMGTVSAAIPVGVLDKIDELVQKGECPSLSSFVREAVALYIKELKPKSE
jgi:Arc/MetJ-type ribon-helix-helix transcriptional regulator